MWWSAAALAFHVKRTEDGDALRWNRWPIEVAFDGRAPPGVRDPAAEIEAAMAQWNEVLGEGALRTTEPQGTPTEGPDATNWLWISEDWPFDPELLAMTSSWSQPGGTLVAFDIRLNGNRVWANDGRLDAFDLRAAVTHELGHVLGLDHSDASEATMYATAAMGESWRAEIAEDDMAGVRFLYPEVATPLPRVFAQRNPLARRGCASTPSASGVWVAALAVRRARRARRSP